MRAFRGGPERAARSPLHEDYCSMKGTHEFEGGERNADILIDVNGELFPRFMFP